MVVHVARLRPDPRNMLWQTALGAMPGFTDDSSQTMGWVRLSHRGVQFTDRIVIPRKQRPYIFSPRWHIRIDAAFEQVVRGCADEDRPAIRNGTGRSWITEPLIAGLLQLHAMGFAHSYEAWADGELAGGVWGLQIGRYVSMNSMFYRLSNASKAAFARGQLLLRDLGFEMIDMGGVPSHLVNFGIEWIRQEQFEFLLDRLTLAEPIAITSNRPLPSAPWSIRRGIPWMRRLERLRGRLARAARRLHGEPEAGNATERPRDKSAKANAIASPVARPSPATPD